MQPVRLCEQRSLFENADSDGDLDHEGSDLDHGELDASGGEMNSLRPRGNSTHGSNLKHTRSGRVNLGFAFALSLSSVAPESRAA